MLVNIIDRREWPFQWKAVNAVVEAADRENDRPDADQAPVEDHGLVFDSRKGISLADAVAWASGLKHPVLLYLYDKNRGV